MSVTYPKTLEMSCPGHFLYQTIDMLLDFLTIQKIWHIHEISLVNNTWFHFPEIWHWHEILLGQQHMRFLWSMTHGMPLHFRNFTFTWDFLGLWHMACYYISYTIQTFDNCMRFPWSLTHGMLLHCLYCSEIWYLLYLKFPWSKCSHIS